MGDEVSANGEIKSRLRNHSMREASANPVKMSGQLPQMTEINEEEDGSHLISKDDFPKKIDSSKT